MTDIHQSGNGEPDEDFEEHIEMDKPVAIRVQKPMDEVMDAQGSYETALRTQIGTGTIDGQDFSIDMPMSGGTWVKFEDSDVVVKFDMNALAGTAYEAALETEYVDED